MWIETCLLHNGQHHISEIIRQQLDNRNIDRDMARAKALPVQFSNEAAGASQHPFSDRHNEAAVLGNPDERERRHEAELRAVPADQRFESPYFSGLPVHLRLVMQRHFSIVDRMSQMLLDHHPLVEMLLHAFSV
ncbi:hypothetical protein D3C71_1490710 [compost metagenome]